MTHVVARRRAFILVEHVLALLACALILLATLPFEVAASLNFVLGLVNGSLLVSRW